MKKKNIQNSFVTYLICNNCQSVYFSNKFMNFCKECNINYLCSILSHSEDPDLLLATLDKPHCETLVNEKIKCNKCNDNCLYLNMKLKRIQCHNKSCTYNEVPHDIEWICNMCNKNFYSNVKVYNPVEVQQIKDIIKLTLLLKKKAHPNKVTCCKDINVLNQVFFHKKECKGILYFGEYNNKTIIVCDKCRAINFLIKFIWTCPICGTRFKDKGTFKTNKSYKKFLSPVNENKKFINHINHNYNQEIKTNNNNNNSNNNSSRKSKETLLSMLKRRSEKNITESTAAEKKDYNSNAENNPNLNNGILNENEKNNNTNKEKQNSENLKESHRSKRRIRNENNNNNGIEKSLTESRINKTLKKKNSFYDKQNMCSNIEPIKEEIEPKINSPIMPKINISDIGLEKFTFHSMSIRNINQKKQTRNPSRLIDKENYLSPKENNNSIYNNYLKCVSISSNKQENKDNKNKIFVTYSKRQEEEENFKNSNENNSNNKNEKISRSHQRSILGSCGNRTRRRIREDKENNNINETNNNNMNTTKREKKEIFEKMEKNERFKKYENINYFSNTNIKKDNNNQQIKNTHTHMITYNKINRNYAPMAVNSTKLIFEKTKKNCHSQENISEANSNVDNNAPKNIHRNKTRIIANANENLSKNDIINNRHSTVRKNDALSNVMKIKSNSKYSDNSENKKENENVEKTEKILTIRNRSIYKYKAKEKEQNNNNSNKELKELYKSEEENKLKNEN